MRKQLIAAAVIAGCSIPSVASAQFGQNPFTATPPGNAAFLPRSGGQRLNNQQFYPFGYGSPLNNGVYGNNGFGNGWNPYGNNGLGGYGSPFSNPWPGGPFGGGVFNNPYQTPWGFGNAFSNSAPFGGYSFYGYGNFSPIVGLNNGWWPYQPAYNYNNPVDQYLNQLFLQGLPGSGSAPSSLNSGPRRN